MDRPFWAIVRNRFMLAYVCALVPVILAADGPPAIPPIHVYGNPEFRHGDNILFMNPLPGGKELLSLANDGTVRIWNLETRREQRRMTAPQYSSFWGAYLFKDGNRLLTATSERGALLWDITKGTVLQSFYFPNDVYRLSMLPNEKTFITGASNGRCYVWDMDTGKITRVFTGHKNSIYCVVAPDDSTVISCGEDDQFISWNVSTGDVNWSKSPGAGDIFSLYLSPDRKSVLVCTEKKGAMLCSVETGEPIWTNEEMTDVRTAAWSHSGQRIALNSEKLVVIDASKGKTVTSSKKVKGYAWSVCWAMDDKKLFASSGRVIQEFDPENGDRLYPPKDVSIKTDSIAPPLAFPGIDHLFIPDWSKSFELRDRKSFEVTGKLELPADYRAFAQSLTTGILATINSRGCLQIVNAARKKHVQTHQLDAEYSTRDMAFSPNGTYLYVSANGKISRWHVPTATVEQTFPAVALPSAPEIDESDIVVIDDEFGPDEDGEFWGDMPSFPYDNTEDERLPEIEQMALSPDGSLIAACLDDGTISIISSLDGTVLQTLIYPMKFKGFDSCCFVDTNPLTLIAVCERQAIIAPVEPGLETDDDTFGFEDDDDGFGFDDDDDDFALDEEEEVVKETNGESELPDFKEPFWPEGGIAVWQFSNQTKPLPDKKALDSLFKKAAGDYFRDRQHATEALIAIGPSLLEVLSGLKTDDPELLTRIQKIRSEILRNNQLKLLPNAFPQMDITDIHPCPGTPNWVMLSNTLPNQSILYCRLKDGVVQVEKRFADTNLHGGVTVDGSRIITGNLNGTISVFELQEAPPGVTRP